MGDYAYDTRSVNIDPRTGGAPMRSGILGQRDILSQNLEQASLKVDALRDRLEQNGLLRASMPSPPNVLKDGSRIDSGSEFAGALSSIAERVRILGNSLDDLLTRIDL